MILKNTPRPFIEPKIRLLELVKKVQKNRQDNMAGNISNADRLYASKLIFALILSFFFLIALFSGCVSSSGGIAASNIPVSGRAYKTIGPVEGEESQWIIDMGLIGFPLGSPPMIVLEEKLMQNSKADALVHMRWSYESIVIFFFVVRQNLYLKADAVIFETPVNSKKRKRR